MNTVCRICCVCNVRWKIYDKRKRDLMIFLSLSVLGILLHTCTCTDRQTLSRCLSLSKCIYTGLLKMLKFIWEINEYLIWILNLCFFLLYSDTCECIQMPRLSNHVHVTHGIVFIIAVILCCRLLTYLGLRSWNHKWSYSGGQSGPPWPILLLGK